MEASPEGYQVNAVEDWVRQNVPELTPPFSWIRLEGGHSNLTYQINDQNGRSAVIRRPPQGELLPKAHDMSREWALIKALSTTNVPVPKPYGFCEDPGVTGAWFYIMGLIDGKPLYNSEDTQALVPQSRRETLAHSFFDALADLHQVDPDAVGLGELGKRDSYVGRQIKTWYRSWTSSVSGANFDDERAHSLQAYFLEHLPDQGPIRVVHGDYGLHNCLFGADCTVAAIVDWEISTLGDPLADLAYALNPWPDPSDERPIAPESATSLEGFPTEERLGTAVCGANRARLVQPVLLRRLQPVEISLHCPWRLCALYGRQKKHRRCRPGNTQNPH